MKEEIPMTAFEARVKKATDEMEADIKKEEKKPAGLSTAKYFLFKILLNNSWRKDTRNAA